MAPSAQLVSKLLGSLYEAAASAEHWPNFFQLLRGTTQADAAFFLLSDPDTLCDIAIHHGFAPEWQRAYSEHYSRHDVLYDRYVAARRAHGEWVGTSRSVISDEEFHRSMVYNEFARPQGLEYQCAAALAGLDGELEGGLGMLRNGRRKAFGKETIELIAILAPHMKQALNMHRKMTQLRQENAELRCGIEALDLALVSLDHAGRMIRSTTAAKRLLEAGDGLRLERGYLRAASSAEHARLMAMIGGAVATGSGRVAESAVRRETIASPELGDRPLWTPCPGGAMLVSRPPPKRPLHLVVTPFSSSEILLDERPAALAFLGDPDARPPSRSAVLRALYGLTPTECRLADLLAQGEILATAAEHLAMSEQTARFHLKIIFRKTGTGRQSSLMRLILELPGARV